MSITFILYVFPYVTSHIWLTYLWIHILNLMFAYHILFATCPYIFCLIKLCTFWIIIRRATWESKFLTKMLMQSHSSFAKFHTLHFCVFFYNFILFICYNFSNLPPSFWQQKYLIVLCMSLDRNWLYVFYFVTFFLPFLFYCLKVK